jgi:DNA replication protein DnaC
MSNPTVQPQPSTILEYARKLRLPTLGGQFARLAEEAAKQGQSHLDYLEALLEAELEERERNAIARRIVEAHFPKVKTLDEFEFQKAPQVPTTLIRHLAEGGYLERSEPVLMVSQKVNRSSRDQS